MVTAYLVISGLHRYFVDGAKKTFWRDLIKMQGEKEGCITDPFKRPILGHGIVVIVIGIVLAMLTDYGIETVFTKEGVHQTESTQLGGLITTLLISVLGILFLSSSIQKFKTHLQKRNLYEPPLGEMYSAKTEDTAETHEHWTISGLFSTLARSSVRVKAAREDGIALEETTPLTNYGSFDREPLINQATSLS